MAANLIVPQVQVKWGGEDLTNPTDGIPGSLVYDVSVEIAAQAQWPSGSMMWSPAGPCFENLIKFSKDKYKEDISIRFYYKDGPEITFYFQYSGFQMNYGNGMDVKVYLNCIKAETSSSAKKSFALNNAEKFKDKGKDQVEVERQITKQFGDKETLPKVIWSKCAEKGAKKTRIQQAYAKDSTYGSQIQQIAQDGGNTITYSNMTPEGTMIIQCPLTWQAKNKEGEILVPEKIVKAEERYGFILGPGIIDTYSRSFQWQPPSQDNTQQASSVPSQPQNKKPQLTPDGTNKSKQIDSAAKTQKSGKGAAGATTPNSQRGKAYSENPEAGEKKQFLTEEQQTQITAELFMTPSIVGITPDDVLYVPSLDPGKDIIEDYKVTSVSYNQSGAEFRVNVQGTRPHGINKPMWEEPAKKFRAIAKKLKTLADWTSYAWNLNRGAATPEVSTAPKT